MRKSIRQHYYRFTISLSRRLGAWIFPVLLWPVTTAFYVLFPGRVRNSARLYRSLFPDRGRLYPYLCAWRQYHNFAALFMERFELQTHGPVHQTSKGGQYLDEAMARGSGGIILMSHMGSWEAAAYLLPRRHPGMKLLLYMGQKHQEKIGASIKAGLARGGVRIIGVDPEGGSALDLIEGVNFLRRGGFISITGDRPWSGKERTVAVNLLGHEVHLLEAPHIIALLSGAPLFVFFAFRIAKGHYHFTVSHPMYVQAASRSDRRDAIRRSAQQYADTLEQQLRRHPLEWWHFEPFLGRPVAKHERSGPTA
jgi:predicted LPLAT superfamily acyltransferase